MKRCAFAVLAILMSSLPAWSQYSPVDKVLGSKHDFSSTGSGTIKATSEQNVCVFCHTPHNANPSVPLWNHRLSQGVTYPVYQSSTLESVVAQPLGSDNSKLCLSCHDGTVALGDTVNNGQIPFQNVTAEGKLPTVASNLGIDLTDDHPIAFTPDTVRNTQIQFPPLGDPVRLDPLNRLQCTSCHDPHDENRDPVQKRFLVRQNTGSAICVTCHELKGGAGANLWSWDGSQGPASSHQSAANVYDVQTNAGGFPWLGSHTGYTTTATNACASCHRPHTAHERERLLKGETDNVCFQCHDGNARTGLLNLQQEFSKQYVHPSIGPQAGHDPAEAPDNIPTRHAACDDCHNPHAARSNLSVVVPPNLSAALLGVPGISSAGVVRDARRGSGDAQYEFEICFKCHGSNPNQPQQPGYLKYGPLPSRQVVSIDLRQAFSATSAHPVVRPSNSMVPSLLPSITDGSGTLDTSRPLTAGAQIACTDCHNSDSGRNLGSGFTGPAGPHGSNVNHILEREYLIESSYGSPGNSPDIPYSASSYALCFKCHSEQSLRNDESFKKHWEHMQIASCATCHDPHGVPGGSSSNAALINFDLNIVAPSSSGRLEFNRTGFQQGTCFLRCHSMDHNPLSYSSID